MTQGMTLEELFPDVRLRDLAAFERQQEGDGEGVGDQSCNAVQATSGSRTQTESNTPKCEPTSREVGGMDGKVGHVRKRQSRQQIKSINEHYFKKWAKREAARKKLGVKRVIHDANVREEQFNKSIKRPEK